MTDQINKWMYGPNGEARIFTNEDDIPEGWQDSPAAFEKKTKSQPTEQHLNEAGDASSVANEAVADTEPKEQPKVSTSDSSATAPEAPKRRKRSSK